MGVPLAPTQSGKHQLILGFLDPWAVAVIVSCFACMFSVVGFVLQKRAQHSLASNPTRWPRIGDIIFSPTWLLGFTLAVLFPLPGDIIAYALAPLSLTAPLSGVTVVLNTIVAPRMLGERLQLWIDLPAMGLICVGVVLSTATGSHSDSYTTLDGMKLWTLALDPVFLAGFSSLAMGLLVCTVHSVWNREGIEEAARTRPTNPPMLDVLVPAFMAAGFGAVTNIWLKALSVMVKSGAPWLHCLVCLLLGVVPPAILQMNFINRGLRLYLQVVFFPTYNALFVLTNTTYGALFYQEYRACIHHPLKLMAFFTGVALVVAGISLFRYRKAQAKEDNADVERPTPRVMELAEIDGSGNPTTEAK